MFRYRFGLGKVLVATLIAAASAFAFPPAQAASDHDKSVCRNEWRRNLSREGLDKTIVACTHIIEDRNESTRTRAFAYAFRGNGNRLKVDGDLDRAIADLSEAIRLCPTDVKNACSPFFEIFRVLADLYTKRGSSYAGKGDRDHAIADFRKAAELGYPKANQELRKLGVAR